MTSFSLGESYLRKARARLKILDLLLADEAYGGDRMHRLRHRQPVNALTVVALHPHRSNPERHTVARGRRPVNGSDVTDVTARPATALTVIMALHQRSVELQARQTCHGRGHPVNSSAHRRDQGAGVTKIASHSARYHGPGQPGRRRRPYPEQYRGVWSRLWRARPRDGRLRTVRRAPGETGASTWSRRPGWRSGPVCA